MLSSNGVIASARIDAPDEKYMVDSGRHKAGDDCELTECSRNALVIKRGALTYVRKNY